jgi:DNA-directed RNA polymerase subunit RPC12/RpoP
MIRFKCPYCAKVLNVEDTDAGKKGKCPGCGKRIGIPRTSAPSDNEIDNILHMLGDGPANSPTRKLGPSASEDV